MAIKIDFTRAELLKIQPTSKREYYQDIKTRHLLLDVTPSGSMSFQVYRKFQGRARRITLGHYDSSLPESREFQKGVDPLTLLNNSPQLNIRMARMMANAVNLKLDTGTDILQVKREAKLKAQGEITLGRAFMIYREEYLIPNGKRTIDDITENFNRYLGEVLPGQKKKHGREKTKPDGAVNWEKRKLSSISKDDVRDLMVSLRENVSEYVANKALEMLRVIYNKMIEANKYDGLNPCAGIKKFKTKPRERFLTGDELPKFFEVIKKESYESLRPFLIILLFTAARRANVMGMRWSDIDFQRKVWAIRSEDSKGDHVIYLNLTDPVIEVLNERKNNGSIWVFPANSKSGHMENANKIWSKFREEAGFSDVRLHDLRRTLASWAAINNVSMLIIAKMLGHRSLDAVKVYAHLQNQPVMEANNLVTGEILNIANKLRDNAA